VAVTACDGTVTTSNVTGPQVVVAVTACDGTGPQVAVAVTTSDVTGPQVAVAVTTCDVTGPQVAVSVTTCDGTGPLVAAGASIGFHPPFRTEHTSSSLRLVAFLIFLAKEWGKCACNTRCTIFTHLFFYTLKTMSATTFVFWFY
jgi:hypothetical protein